MVRESQNPTGPKAHLATPNQECQFQILPFLDDLIVSVQKIKNINWFFPIGGQRISQSDWTRDKTGNTKFSTDAVDQRILQSSKKGGTTSLTKSGNLRCYLPLINISMQNN